MRFKIRGIYEEKKNGIYFKIRNGVKRVCTIIWAHVCKGWEKNTKQKQIAVTIRI